MKKQTFNVCSILLICFFVMQFVSAVDFNNDITNEDKETFNEILEPVVKVYNLLKYCATFIALVMLLYAGSIFVTSGSDIGKREKAKNMAMYVVIGLAVIWASPLIVDFIIG